jgi:ubiquinone/menaquinone biosynthesis C-methylase UbiE
VSNAAAFSGSIPASYDRYLVPWLFEAHAADLAERVPTTDELRVLEIAAGTGAVTRRLRAVLPASATLVATDLNDAMVDYGRDAVGDAGIEWRTADAQALPFDDAGFDVVICAFGFMFLPDKVQGFREARRVLAPGGTLLATVWASLDENPWARAYHATLARLFPDDPPRFLETPYGYDSERLESDLTEAGWDDVSLETVRRTTEAESAQVVARGLATGSPLAAQLKERGADPETVIAEAARDLANLAGERPFRAELAATVITATR